MTWKVTHTLIAGMTSALQPAAREQASRSSAAPVKAETAITPTDPALRSVPQPRHTIRPEPIGQFKHGEVGNLASEIAAYAAGVEQLIVANVDEGTFDFLNRVIQTNPASSRRSASSRIVAATESAARRRSSTLKKPLRRL